MQLGAALLLSGVRLLLGTDTPNQYIVPGFAVHEELANLVEVGLTPFEVIRAADQRSSGVHLGGLADSFRR